MAWAVFTVGAGIVEHIRVNDKKAPVLFSVGSPNATYKIGMRSRNYTLLYFPAADEAKSIEVMVGTSRVSLAGFVGKTVRVRGTFADYPSNRQCVAERCHRLFETERMHAVVVDIESVEAVNE
jgi:hypothetical protein